MPEFRFIAVDLRGAESAGSVEAPDARQAVLILRARGLFPTRVEPAKAPHALVAATSVRANADVESGHARRGWSLGRQVKPREVAILTRQLATMLRAGMPLLRGLEVLARQERNAPLRRVLTGLAEGIKSGGTLSGAMAQYPRVFDRLYLNMIKAGEAGGVLDVVLERLARFQEKSLQLKGQVKAAMVYPLIVMGVALAILVGLLVFVVPKFKQIFADLLKGAPLPPLTQLVLTLSDAVKAHSLAAIGVVVVSWLVGRMLLASSAGVHVVDTLTIRLPVFGDFFLKGIVARFGRTLGTLLASGVPILPALLITRDTCGNSRVAGAITVVHDRVREGASVARPLESTGVFPAMVTSMMDVGEHTGQMPEMLGKIADIYEGEVDNAVAGLSSLIEPVMILFLAVMVGTIVFALFLPIVRIVQLLT